MTATDILFHSHCGKKCIILEKIADSSLLRLQIDACLRIKNRFSVNDDLSLIRCLNSRNTAKSHALTTAGCAKKPDGCRAALKFYFQGKIPEIFFNIYADCHQIHLLVFIPLPDTMLINATITKDISTITTTQNPAVP